MKNPEYVANITKSYRTKLDNYYSEIRKYVYEEESEINLLTIYDKAERENISRNEIEEILGSSEL